MNPKKAGVVIFLSVKVHITTKRVMNQGHFIIIKELVYQEVTTFVNIYVPNVEAPKYLKHILTDLNGQVDNNAVIVGNFGTSFSITDHPDRKSMRKHSVYTMH